MDTSSSLINKFENQVISELSHEISLEFFSESGQLGLFASTTIDYNNIEFQAVRLLERSRINFLDGYLSGGGILVFAIELGKKEIIKFIPRGEDPRLFRYRNQVYIYFHKFDFKNHSNSLWIQNLTVSQAHPIQINFPDNFVGKNWSPYEYDDSLFFIHTFSPLHIVKLDEQLRADLTEITVKTYFLEGEKANWEWGAQDGSGFHSSYRGGTPGVDFGGEIYFIGHKTLSKNYANHHTLFAAKLNHAKSEIELVDLMEEKSQILCDAFGISKNADHLFVDVSISTGFVAHPENPIALAKLKIPFYSLYDLFRL